MSSYIGFVAPKKTVDWSELAGDVVETFKGIEEQRLKEQEKLTKIYQDTKFKVDNIEMGKSPSANELFLDGSTQAKENIYNASVLLKNGQMTPMEWRNFMNNTNASFDAMINSVKSFDTRSAENMKRQEPDENGFVAASQAEIDILGYVAQMTDLNGAEMYQDPSSGNFYMVKRDVEGNIASTVDFNVLNKPGNIRFNKVDLNSAVSKIKETGEKDKKFKPVGTRIVSTEGVKIKEGYDEWARSQAYAVVSNDRAAASVLLDYPSVDENNNTINYITYFDSESYNNKQDVIDREIQAKEVVMNKKMSEEEKKEFSKEIEKRMIRMYQDNSGTWQPDITEDQQKKAIDVVKSKIDMSFGTSETSTAGSYGRGRVSGTNSSTAAKDYPLVQAVAEEWINNDWDAINNRSKKDYKFTWSGKDLIVEDVAEKTAKTFKNAKIDDLYDYIDDVGQSTWMNQVNSWRKAGGKAGSGSGSEDTKFN